MTSGSASVRVALILREAGAICPCKWSLSSEIYSFQVDTENAVTSEIEINDAKGILIVKGNVRTLIWTIDQTALYIIGEINDDEIIKIAENITFKEKIEK
jgi:hypothetical protein